MASFLLTQFEVGVNFWTTITVLFIWEESSGPFCLLCPERSQRKVLVFFFHAECNIKIEVNKLKVQCGIDSLFPLAKSLFRFSEGYEFIDNYR